MFSETLFNFMLTETRFEFMFSETLFNFMFTGRMSFGNPPVKRLYLFKDSFAHDFERVHYYF